jgi:hypothetical protein
MAPNDSLAEPQSTARIFGIPVGGFGLFTTLLLPLACGFIAFFGTTFVGIVIGLGYLFSGHPFTGFDVTYKVYGLTAGVLVYAVAFVYLTALWIRRKIRP